MSNEVATRIPTPADQIAFSSLSGDFNPIHVDSVIGRRTIAGAPVVRGVHSALWSLDKLVRLGKVARRRIKLRGARRRPLRSSNVFRLAAAQLLILCNSGLALASCPHYHVAHPFVQTLAGNGEPSQTNGPARQAGFVGPMGVALGPDGAIYVADTFGQTVRRIKDGFVSDFAGVSSASFSPQQRIGGYVNGPVTNAKFSHPDGIAVDKNGTVFVADTDNHVIRKIANGTVSTFAGSKISGTRDGNGRDAQFLSPRDIALDADGNLYVADFGVGVRKITTDGTVSTLSLGDDDSHVCGVAAKGSGDQTVIAMTDSRSVSVRQGKWGQRLPFVAGVEPQNEGRVVGFGCRLAIYDRYSVVMADPIHNVVKFVRFGTETPVGAAPVAEPLASGTAPSAVAIRSDSSVVFADTGRRRIAIINDIDPRGMLGPSLAGITRPSRTYRIVFFGDSFNFYGVTWPQSMQAQVEAGLARDHDLYGLGECPSVVAIRYSGISILDVGSFLTSFLGDGEADLVIVPIDGDIVGIAERRHPELSPAALDASIRQQLTAAQRTLGANGTKMLLVPVPYSTQVSPLEQPSLPADFLEGFQQAQRFEDRVASFGVRTLRLSEEIEKAERSRNRVAFGDTADPHPSPEGFSWVGKAIVRYLEAWRPWKV